MINKKKKDSYEFTMNLDKVSKLKQKFDYLIAVI